MSRVSFSLRDGAESLRGQAAPGESLKRDSQNGFSSGLFSIDLRLQFPTVLATPR